MRGTGIHAVDLKQMLLELLGCNFPGILQRMFADLMPI
jgi:hypothetical protein